MDVLVDTESPGTIEDIETKTPGAEHTGNVHRLCVLSAPPELRLTTTGGGKTERMSGLVFALDGQHRATAMRELQRTQGAGRESLHFLSYLNSRLRDETFSWPREGRSSRLTLQLSRPVEELVFRLAVHRWKELYETLIADVAEMLQPTKAGGLAWPMLQSTAVRDMTLALPPSAEAVQQPDPPSALLHHGSVGEVLHELREMIDLPVQDIARMCGVRRRQFYNLMNGTSGTTPAQERRMRDLHAKVTILYDALGHQGSRVRTALLTPLDGEGSFYDAVVGGDTDEIDRAFELLGEQVRRGETDRRRLAPSGLLNRDDPAWRRGSSLLRSQGSEEMPQELPDER